MPAGFAPSTEVYEFVCSGRQGRLMTITCACDRKRNQYETDMHAFKVAIKIFNLIINPENEEAEKALYYEFDYNMVEAVKELHTALEIDLNDPYLLLRLKLKRKKEWVKFQMVEGHISRAEIATLAAQRDRPSTFSKVDTQWIS